MVIVTILQLRRARLEWAEQRQRQLQTLIRTHSSLLPLRLIHWHARLTSSLATPNWPRVATSAGNLIRFRPLGGGRSPLVFAQEQSCSLAGAAQLPPALPIAIKLAPFQLFARNVSGDASSPRQSAGSILSRAPPLDWPALLSNSIDEFKNQHFFSAPRLGTNSNGVLFSRLPLRPFQLRRHKFAAGSADGA